ncbi:MlaD family protein [Pseudonocardia sp. EC080625-04]|uniref:MlaD family protein n=1 Tax=Pseudonocardia sp. EC080625-04 TaxID=1096868 RepID=UPI000B2142E0|nr:MlaD family protein [Pseudonocardia sp. EC080625-04]
MASAKPARGARFRSGVIGLLIFVAAGFSLYVALTAQKGLPFAQHEFRTAAITDTGDLAVGNDVRIGQVRVGRVDAIDLADGVPQVRMQLDDGETSVYRDGSAAVTGRSGLGQQYLDLDSGTPQAGELGEDEVLPESRSRGAVQLLDLAEVFDPATQDATRSSLQQLGNGAAGHGQDLQDVAKAGPEILPDLGTTARSLSLDGGRDLTTMLRSLESLSSRFSGREQEISSLVGQLDTTFAAIDADRGEALGGALDIAPEALPTARKALEDLQQPLASTNSAMTQLQPGARSLGDATPDLRGVLTEAPRPLDKLPGVSESAEPALGSLTPAVEDARPVAPKVTQAVGFANTPLQVLAPYSPEISQWFTSASFALSDGDAAGHHLWFTLLPRTESLTGAAGVEDPLRSGDPYPAPGETPGQASQGILPAPGESNARPEEQPDAGDSASEGGGFGGLLGGN